MNTSTRHRYIFSAILTSLAFSLSACTHIPIYQQPADIKNSAHLRLSLVDESLLSGIAMIHQVEGIIVCGEPLPGLKKMLVISKGNPLVSNLNPNGVYIPAEKKFTFSAIGLNDGFRECGRVVSFVPKAGANYEITLRNVTTRLPMAEPMACPIEVVDVSQNTTTSTKSTDPVPITYEQCQPRK